MSEQTARLVRDELKLARAEYTEKAKQGGTAAGLFGAGAILAWFGVGTLLATLILVLALFLPAWAAALIVTAAVFIAAGIAAAARQEEGRGPHPRAGAHGRDRAPRRPRDQGADLTCPTQSPCPARARTTA
ncbi:phage holin family protein [Brachybacterium sp. GPGPB12]|uniref:phage holin family protein n=1 Tax=Brachybacterium sp. GPGPB12 TaxID=3023517 RepID=UPI0031345E78